MKEKTQKIKLRLTDWELRTIIKLLEDSKKHDKQNIIDQYDKSKKPISPELMKSLDEIEKDFEVLIDKLYKAQKK